MQNRHRRPSSDFRRRPRVLRSRRRWEPACRIGGWRVSWQTEPTAMALRSIPGTTDRRIDTLLALLAYKNMIIIRGAKIARQIGVTRSSVWRWTEKLRVPDLKVKGHPRTDYQIDR